MYKRFIRIKWPRCCCSLNPIFRVRLPRGRSPGRIPRQEDASAGFFSPRGTRGLVPGAHKGRSPQRPRRRCKPHRHTAQPHSERQWNQVSASFQSVQCTPGGSVTFLTVISGSALSSLALGGGGCALSFHCPLSSGRGLPCPGWASLPQPDSRTVCQSSRSLSAEKCPSCGQPPCPTCHPSRPWPHPHHSPPPPNQSPRPRAIPVWAPSAPAHPDAHLQAPRPAAWSRSSPPPTATGESRRDSVGVTTGRILGWRCSPGLCVWALCVITGVFTREAGDEGCAMWGAERL